MPVALSAVAVAVGVIGCSRLSEEHLATAEGADVAAARITNNPRLEHFEDMTQQNLLLAAKDEHVEVVAVSRLEPRKTDSIYEWNELVIKVEATTAGFNPHLVTACWSLVFEGRVQVGDEVLVECPGGPPPTVSLLPTTASDPVSTVDVEQRNETRRRIEGMLDNLDGTRRITALEDQVAANFTDLEAWEIRVAAADGRVAVALDLGGECWYGLKSVSVIAWQPVSGDHGLGCTAERALDGPP